MLTIYLTVGIITITGLLAIKNIDSLYNVLIILFETFVVLVLLYNLLFTEKQTMMASIWLILLVLLQPIVIFACNDYKVIKAEVLSKWMMFEVFITVAVAGYCVYFV